MPRSSMFRQTSSRLAAIAFALISTFAASAQTTRNVPSGYPTIQSAINASSNGDTVLVAPGTYLENINFSGKVIVVAATSTDPTQTILDGSSNPALPTVRFVSGEGRGVNSNGQPAGTTLQGFTIRNGGGASPTGSDTVGAIGGIYISGSAPIIAGNIITGNACFGIHSYASQPLIQGNQITATNATAAPCHSAGAGVLIDGVPPQNAALAPVLQGNSIFNNNFLSGTSGGSGIVIGGYPAVAIENNTLFGNQNFGPGGAIQVSGTDSVFILDNLIVNNQAEQGAAIWFDNQGSSTGLPNAAINNNTIVGNSNVPSPADAAGDADAQVVLRDGLSRLVVANNIIYGTVATTAGLSCINLQPAIPPSIDTNDIFNNAGGRTVGGDSLCQGQLSQTAPFGNVSVDPQFRSFGTDFHLLSTSPLIDTGSTSALSIPTLNGLVTAPDLDRIVRVLDATASGIPVIDFGAYEAQNNPVFLNWYELLLTATPSSGSSTANFYEIPGGTPAQLTARPYTSATGSTTLGTVTLTQTNPDNSSVTPPAQPLAPTPSPGNPNGSSTTFTTANLSPGLYTFAAAFAAPNGAPTRAVHTYVLVDPYASNINLSCTPVSPVTYGQPVVLNIAFSSANGGGVPPGSLALTVDTPPLTDTIQPDPTTGDATYTFGPSPANASLLPVGTHTITLSYAGTPTFSPATAHCTVTVIAPTNAATTTTLTANPTTGTLGQTITFNAAVSNTAAPGTIPTGTVQLFDGSSPLGAPATLNGSGNTAPIPINTLTQGTHTVTAVYTPTTGAAFNSSTSNAVTVTITGQATNTVLVPSPNPAFALSAVTLTTTVQSTQGGAAPTGTVSFFDGATLLGNAVNLTGGTATLTYSGFLANANGTSLTHALHAVYSGDTTYAPTTSAIVNEVINPNPTVTTIVAVPGNTAAFLPVALSAHTSSSTSAAAINTASASVIFFANGAAIGTAPVDAAGNAALTYNPPAGNYTITASFSGSTVFAPSTATPGAPLAVTPVQPVLSLVAAPSTIIVRQTTQLTATLSANGAPPVALSGTVTFGDGTAVIGSAALANGIVTVPYTPTTPGTHVLFAHFGGNGSLLPADATFTLTVLPQDFTITPSSPSITIKTEHHLTTAVRIDTVGGLVDTIDLACDNLPAYLTCEFRPAAVAVGATTGGTASETSTTNVSLYLDTDFVNGYAQLRSPTSPRGPGHTSPLGGYGPAVLALLCPAALLVGLRRRIALPRLLLAMIVSAGVLSASGCSGLYPPHVVPGTYTVTLTGHAENNNFTRTAPITIVVTQ